MLGESGMEVDDVGDDVIVSEVMGKSTCAGFSRSIDTKYVQPMRSNA